MLRAKENCEREREKSGVRRRMLRTARIRGKKRKDLPNEEGEEGEEEGAVPDRRHRTRARKRPRKEEEDEEEDVDYVFG